MVVYFFWQIIPAETVIRYRRADYLNNSVPLPIEFGAHNIFEIYFSLKTKINIIP